jgi:hypothetical protein
MRCICLSAACHALDSEKIAFKPNWVITREIDNAESDSPWLQTFFSTKLTQYKPLDLNSAEYADDFNTTATLGSKNSTARKEYDTETAWFWADLDGETAA